MPKTIMQSKYQDLSSIETLFLRYGWAITFLKYTLMDSSLYYSEVEYNSDKREALRVVEEMKEFCKEKEIIYK